MIKTVTKPITNQVDQTATTASVTKYLVNENAVFCDILDTDSKTIAKNRVYSIDKAPFDLTENEIALLTGEKPDETWDTELVKEFLKKNSIEYTDETTDFLALVPADYVNTVFRGRILSTDEKTEAIKIKYDEIQKQGFTTSLGFKIDCMANNITDFDQSLTLLTLSGAEDITVRDYDNVNHTVTSTQYNQLCLELGVYIMTLRQQRWTEVDSLVSE